MCALISISQIYQYSYVKWFNLNCAHNDYVFNFRNMFVSVPYSRVSLFFLSPVRRFIYVERLYLFRLFLLFGRRLCFIRCDFAFIQF